VTHVQTATAFTSQDSTARLVAFEAGEQLTILKKEVGGDASWWKGMNQRGQVGLLPASAVNMRPQPAPSIPQQFHAPDGTLKRKSMTLAPGTLRFAPDEEPDDFLRRETNVAPPVPMTLKPLDADGFQPATVRGAGSTLGRNATLGRSQQPPEPASPRPAPGTMRTLRPTTVHYEPDGELPDDLVGGTGSIRLRPVSTYYPERPVNYQTARAEPTLRPTAQVNPVTAVEYRTARPQNTDDDDDDDPNLKYRTQRRDVDITSIEELSEEELDFTGKRRTVKREPEPAPPSPRSPRRVEPPAPARRKNYDDDDTGCYEQARWNCEEVASKLCWAVGRFVSKCAACVIIVALLLAGAATVGVLKFSAEARAGELWALPDGNATAHLRFINATFERTPRISSLILQTPGPIPTARGNESDDDETRKQLAEVGNVLETKFLLDALTLHQRVVSLSVTETDGEADNGNDTDAGTFAFENVCQRRRAPGAECRFASPLAAWNYDRQAIVNDADPVATLNAALPNQMIEAMLGGAKRELVNGTLRVVAARALRFEYFLEDRALLQRDADATDDDDGRLVDFAADRWESGLLNITREDDARQLAELQVFPSAARSLLDAYGANIEPDGLALGVSVGLVALYAMLFLSRSSSAVHSRVLLALGAVLTTLLAIGAMFGLSSALDYAYGPLQAVLPFILLGVGVDAAFLLAATIDEPDWSEKYHRRGQMMMAGAGLSLLYGTCTTLAAFGCGAILPLPAVRGFCVWALIGVTALFVLQLTFLAACTVVDSRRQKGDRLDCGLCCFQPCCDGERPEPKSNLKRDGSCLRYPVWFYVAKIVAHPIVAAVVVVVSLAGAAVGAYGGSLLRADFAVERYVPVDSYLRNHSLAHAAYFNATGDELQLVFRGVDHFDKRAALASVLQKVYASDEIERDAGGNATAVPGWLSVFDAARDAGRWGGAAAATDKAWWHGNLTRFLQANEGAEYRGDVVFDKGESNKIAASRHTLRLVAVNGTLARAEQMVALRDAVADAARADSLAADSVFAFSDDFLYLEHAPDLVRDTINAVGIAVACVVVLTLLCVNHSVPALAVCVSALLTLGDVLGVLFLADTDVDAVVAVVVAFSVGTSVTYAALVGRAYVWARGDRRERVRDAVERVGPVATHGAVTTLLAIVVLAFRPSEVYRTFFKIMSSFLLFGLWNAVAFVPAVLALLGPRSTIQFKPNNDDAYE
jgi:predicted RND superfamily exporter protein